MKETMTRRQRVLRALEHKSVDRTPIDLGMHFSSGISAFAYQRLREHLGLDAGNIEMVDMVQLLARVDEDVLERFHCDCMLLHAGWKGTKRWNPRGNYSFHIPDTAHPVLEKSGRWVMQTDGAQMIMPEGGYFFDGAWPDFHCESFECNVKRLALEAERIYKETDYFTTYMQFPAFFGDIEWMCDAITNPDAVKRENERALKAQIAQADHLLSRMGKYIQAIALNADLGNQQNPWIRQEDFLDVTAPYLRAFCRHIHQNSDVKIFMHTCGSIKELIPALIDCEVDVINPVQISARNMNPQDLKAQFGDKIAFWGGGCDTQNVLNRQTPDQVRQNVRDLMKVFAPGSGFVFNQVHNIMGDIAPENIVAMLDTAYEEAFRYGNAEIKPAHSTV